MTTEDLINTVSGLTRMEKTELACRIIEGRLLDYFLVLDCLGIGEINQELQERAEEMVHSKVLLYDRLDHIPVSEIREYVNHIYKEMQ